MVPAVLGDNDPGVSSLCNFDQFLRMQFFNVRSWGQEETDIWSGVSIKRPDCTMVGTIWMEKGRQWVEYIEKLFSGGKLQTTIVSVCRPIPGSKGPSAGF
jgi:hypothetical protein